MRNLIARLTGLGLCLCLLVSLAFPAFAADPQEKADLTISTAEDFLLFAERCRLDSYSRELVVSLEADLELGGLEFDGIPIFSGTFYGNGHSISGISLTHDGSVQGFIRYLTDGALVQELTVRGQVVPGGSSSRIGGIVGSNSGTVKDCRFEGSVGGTDLVGGIAGENTVSGLLDGCTVSGSVTGDHFVGGMTGRNSGVIRSCRNHGKINTTVDENQVDLTKVTIHTVTGTEAVNTVTDIGGIAGANDGLLRDCENKAQVGYPHIGYNIGGIAGSQKGYLLSCRNEGTVFGRKEVGGIAGQLEPVAHIEFQEDTLQILHRQLGDTIDLADQAANNAQSSSDSISGQVDALRSYSQSARDAIDEIIVRPGEPLPDRDQLIAAKNALTGSLTGMKDTSAQLGHSAQSAITGTVRDLTALTGQLKQIRDTLGEAPEHLGGTVTDVSDLDTDDDITGKIARCSNYGSVQGDLNVGGILGSIAPENDLDPEDDLALTQSLTLNFSGEMRSVVRSCDNHGPVSGKKWNIGGIVGRMTLGLVKDCLNAGTLDASPADYVGGIAGAGAGYIRSCSSKCLLYGRRWVGGIAGTAGAAVTDCRSMVLPREVQEKSGAIVGHLPSPAFRPETELKNNIYLSLPADPGGIDGISYDGAAFPLEAGDFFALPQLPAAFSSARVTFLYEDGREEVVSVPTGETLDPARIPALPESEDSVLQWEGLEEALRTPVYFDRVYRLSVTPHLSAIQSLDQRPDGRPVLLAEGLFPGGDRFTLEPDSAMPEVSGKKTPRESWAMPALSQADRLRLAIPGDYADQQSMIFLRSADGSWREAQTRLSGSYILFEPEAGDEAFCLVTAPRPFPWGWCLGGSAAGLAVIVLAVLLLRRRKKKKQAPAA